MGDSFLKIAFLVLGHHSEILSEVLRL